MRFSPMRRPSGARQSMRGERQRPAMSAPISPARDSLAAGGHATNMRRVRRGAVAVVLLGTGAIVGGLLADTSADSAWHWLHWICKPLTTLVIVLLAWQTLPALSPCYRRWILAGLGGSLLGDVLLMLPQDLFVPGLLAFLLGHLCFLAAFLGDSRCSARPWMLLASYGYGALNVGLLWGAIAAPLRLPVLVYVFVLASMGGQAAARAAVFVRRHDPQARSAVRAAVGALLFMLSDSLLAWDRFRGPLPLALMGVLATYYLALWWIARSVERREATEGMAAQ
jgi:uncharacterized membrane protein YhhN